MKLKILIAVLLFIILGMLIMRTKEGFDAADAPALASSLGSSMNKELVQSNYIEYIKKWKELGV